MGTTLQRVDLLFDNLAKSSGSHQTTANHKAWQEYVRKVGQSDSYDEDGDPVVFGTQTENGVNICCYRWSNYMAETGEIWPPRISKDQCSPILASSNWFPIDWVNTKGVFVFIHGVTENARFALLRLKSLHKIVDFSRCHSLTDEELKKLTHAARNGAVEQELRGSWLHTLTTSGFVVYAMDLQGHGLSSSWEGSRCNVERFSHFCDDVSHWIEGFMNHGEFDCNAPIYLSGISMGGCIAIRTYQQLLWNTGIPIKGLVLFCPAISTERLKKKSINRLLLPISGWLSSHLPKLRTAALERNRMFPYIDYITKFDPLVYSDNLPTRLSAELIVAMDAINAEIHKIQIPVLLLQSIHDSMTDPEGSKIFMENVAKNSPNTMTHWFDFNWHYLSKEPAYLEVIDVVIDWIKKL